ncbi:MAG: nucleoside 2-deoxyribosyltransferase [Anaerolineae bacterium]
MKIYFAGSIVGGRENAQVYAQIVEYLLTKGHEVPSAHVARPDVLDWEEKNPPSLIYERDIGWIRECEALIAEVSTPSMGVGYEIATALQWGKPVLCLYHQGSTVSKMILGNAEPSIRVEPYTTSEELLSLIDGFLWGL